MGRKIPTASQVADAAPASLAAATAVVLSNRCQGLARECPLVVASTCVLNMHFASAGASTYSRFFCTSVRDRTFCSLSGSTAAVALLVQKHRQKKSLQGSTAGGARLLCFPRQCGLPFSCGIQGTASCSRCFLLSAAGIEHWRQQMCPQCLRSCPLLQAHTAACVKGYLVPACRGMARNLHCGTF